MKKFLLPVVFFVFARPGAFANEPDSVYLFSYATEKNNNHNGLQFAWSPDRKSWHPIGADFAYLKSDYGRWGSEKRMITPYLLQGLNGVWQCVWSLNEKDKVFAHASSFDLVDWGRQSYPVTKAGANVLQPVIAYNKKAKQYGIGYTDVSGRHYRITTKDFKVYSPATEVTVAYENASLTLSLPAGNATGQLHYVPWAVVDKLIKTYELQQYQNASYGQSAKDDAKRFAGLQPVNAAITVQPEKAKPISDKLTGIFFEDINYAADGGLYAELVQNRDFEYRPSDKEYRDKAWTSMHSWTLKGEGTSFTVDSASPLHAANPHYAVLDTKAPGAYLVNAGYDGIAVKAGEQYSLSLFAKQLEGREGRLRVRLTNKEGEVLAEATVYASSNEWKKATAVLTASAGAADAVLELQPLASGRLALDMISLFPQHTFKGRSNGLRSDLAEVVAGLHPRFVRFPGGCVAHGDGLGNIYRWKATIGPLETRKPQRNLWGYHQSVGLGYFEYFQFCEDIGAEPLPVLAAGVPCQNSGTGGAGQQGGIPLAQMDGYVQDVLDLVEWANGDATTKWGALRAAAGHPAPFRLKYIGIGNEDLITDIFEERFTMIYKALREKHPEITVIGTVGPFYKGTDYEEGWAIAKKLSVPVVDEHYYESPGWFLHNQDFYDRYDRKGPKVYLGEYASRGNTLYNALAEALYLTSLERNGDVVQMSSYAPLLAKEGHTQWNPDLIYFSNNEVKPTVNYEVQKLFGNYTGNEYLPAAVTLSNNEEAVKKRIASSVVRDRKTGDVTIKLVNLLPVAVNASLDLSGLSIAEAKGKKITLQGRPEDKKAKAVEADVPVSETFTSGLPAYSLTVIRMKTNRPQRQ